MGADTILLVDDEPPIVDLYAAFLEDRYEVLTATGGAAALDAMDGSVDLVVLDRRMPELSGDELLERLRERGFEGPVLVITGVDPDVDIIPMAFTDYLVKPASGGELRDRVEILLRLAEYDSAHREYFACRVKEHALRADGTAPEDERYAELRNRIERLEADLERAEELDGLLAGRLDAGVPEPTP